MTRALALLGALLAALEARADASTEARADASTEARAEAPACRAEVVFEPARAVVGQQVIYRVRILRRDEVVRVDWTRPPAFPAARVEELPPDPRPDRQVDGALHHVHDEVRALFPERAGALRVAGAGLRCALAHGGVHEIAVPEAVLPVDALPESGRPDGFSGLVGPLLLYQSVTPERIRLGESLRVALLARGAGNLWLLERGFEPGAFGPTVDVFERPAELVLERGRELSLRRHLALDVVPRETGTLRVPALRIPFFDPVRGAYRVATTEEVQVAVEAPAADSGTDGVTGARPAARGADAASRGRRWIWPLAAAFAAGAGAGVALRRRRRADASVAALRAAEAARSAGDLEAEQRELSRALRAGLARVIPDAQAANADELAAHADAPAALRDAVSILRALERARFEPGAPAVAADDVRRALRDLARLRARGALRRRAVAGLLLAGALGAGAPLTGCASTGVSRDEPMTPARLEAWLREETSAFEEVDGQLRFLHDGVRMICLHDVRADRVRVVAAVTEESALTVVSARILLQANFGNTLDARYAIRDGVLYAVYLHPLSLLTPRELEAALDQIANLVRNFGTTFSAVERRAR